MSSPDQLQTVAEPRPDVLPEDPAIDPGLSIMSRIANTKAGQFMADVAMSLAVIAPGAAVVAVPASANADGNVPALAGELSLPGVPEAEVSMAETARASSIEHHSTLNIQGVLNKIRHIAMPHYPDNKSDNLHYVHPTYGYANNSIARFRTDCSDFLFKFYEITPAGSGYKTCGPGLIPFNLTGISSKPNEFQGAINRLGDKVETSVGEPDSTETIRVYGTRKKLTVLYDCPEPGTTTTATDVSKIVVHKNHTAAITEC